MAGGIIFLLDMPFFFRVAIFFLFALIIWRVTGKIIFFILSVIPFLAKKIFFILYWIIDLLFASLHKKFGTFWGKIDNFWSSICCKIDKILTNWYQSWHFEYHFKRRFVWTIYSIFLIWIIVPYYVNLEHDILNLGEKKYLAYENRIREHFEEVIVPTSVEDVVINEEDTQEELPDKKADFRLELTVTGIKSSLLVRKVPDIKNGEILERLHNGNIVIWNGEMVFANVEDNRVETWVKVVTQNGTEGWSRLHYLYPANYSEMQFEVSSVTR